MEDDAPKLTTATILMLRILYSSFALLRWISFYSTLQSQPSCDILFIWGSNPLREWLFNHITIILSMEFEHLVLERSQCLFLS